MKVWEKKLVPISFAVSGVLFLFAGVLKPAIKGQPLNVVFLCVGALLIILGIATSRKSGDDSGPPKA